MGCLRGIGQRHKQLQRSCNITAFCLKQGSYTTPPASCAAMNILKRSNVSPVVLFASGGWGLRLCPGGLQLLVPGVCLLG